jgi:hypothetical protein
MSPNRLHLSFRLLKENRKLTLHFLYVSACHHFQLDWPIILRDFALNFLLQVLSNFLSQFA